MLVDQLAAQCPLKLTSYEQLVWDAFGQLSTERSTGMALGLIPRSAISTYAVEQGMMRPWSDRFIAEIMAMDRMFVTIRNKQNSAKTC